jgi:ATP adenylyltransferase
MPEQGKNLWAPWRMEYIDSLSAPAGGCFLCHYREHPENDAEQLVVRRSKHAMVLLNRFPYSNGHMLITPLQHVGKLEDLDDDVLLELMQLTRDCKLVLEPAFNAQGFNVGINLGHCAGAGLPDHIHIHIVPRWAGDTNYMAVIGDVKVMPMALVRSYEKFLQVQGELGLG